MPGNVEVSEDKKIEDIRKQLQEYGEENKLKGLEGRIERGLDPAGMLAVKETREKLEKIAKALGAKIENVVKLTNELHVGAIWDRADDLVNGYDPAVETWMIAAEIAASDEEKKGDLEKEEFLKDYKRVNWWLDKAVEDPEWSAKQAKEDLIESSKEQFKMEDGVPISKLDSGFLAMAVNGYEAGVVEQGGMLFVGAKELDFDVLEKLGLHTEEKEDRGRKAIFYVDENGKDIVKKLYPGLGIVLTGDKKLAKELVVGTVGEKIRPVDVISIRVRGTSYSLNDILKNYPGYVEYDSEKHNIRGMKRHETGPNLADGVYVIVQEK